MKILVVTMKSRLLSAAFMIFALGLAQSHIRVTTTLVGYRLGSLKSQETELLTRRGQLKMQLARLSTKSHLDLMSETKLSGTTTKMAVAVK